MNINLQEVTDKIKSYIENAGDLYSSTQFDVTFNAKKAEKMNMGSVTTIVRVSANKDGVELETPQDVCVTLYILEKSKGVETVFVNDDTHDIVYTKFGFMEKPEGFDESKYEFVPIMDNTLSHVFSYLDNSVKYIKGYPKEKTPGKGNGKNFKKNNKRQ